MKTNKTEGETKFRFKSVLCWLMLVCGLLVQTGVVDAGGFWPFVQADVNTSQATAAQEEVRELVLGVPIERELAGGEAHVYQIALASDQYLHLIVDQRGIDVTVTLFEPNGQQIGISERRRQGLESVFFVAKAPGTYQVQVRSLDQKTLPGRYEVKVEEQRKATSQDEERIAMRRTAERAFAEGLTLSEQTTPESRQKAIEKYEEALTLWQVLGDSYEQGHTVNKIGYLYQRLGQTQKALDYFHQALQLFQFVGSRSGEGGMLAIIGTAYALGDARKALDYFHQALPLLRSVNDRMLEAATLVSMGVAYVLLEEKQNALYYLRQALPLWQALGDPFGEAQTLSVMAAVYRFFGQQEVASSYLREAERLRKGVAHGQEATPKLWDYIAAESAFGEGIRLLTEGTTESRRKGIEKLEKSLQLWRVTPDRLGEANLLFTLGSAHVEAGEPAKALNYLLQALPVWRTGAFQLAELTTLLLLGHVNFMLNKEPEALGFLRQALELSRRLGDRNAEALALCDLARVERNSGHLVEAQIKLELGLRILESLRTKIASPDWRTTYNASNQEYYEFYTGLLMELHKADPTEGYDAGALQANERTRARSLLEILTEARADIRQGVDPVLLENERDLQQLLNDKELNQMRLLSGKPTQEQVAVAKKEVEGVLARYQEVQAQIRARSPKYAALTQPQPLGLAEIQRQVLDEDTLLLEYALGEERSFLWAVTATSIKSYELPKRKEVEEAARQVYGMFLTEEDRIKPEPVVALSRMLLGPVADQLNKKRIVVVADGALQYLPFGALPKPAVSHQPSAFSKTTDHGPRTTDNQPLIVDHEIINLPSASVLAVLRKELAGRPSAPKTVAVLADPVFQSDDPRVKSQNSRLKTKDPRPKTQDLSPNPPSEIRHPPSADEPSSSNPPSAIRHPPSEDSPAWRSGREAGLVRFDRLPQNRVEADHITALAPKDGHLEALDFQASRATATSPELSHYRIVHFATHGLLNNVHPELSGIVLSLVDERGQPQDGFLRLHEIYNLSLSADLVVLSACQTALGKEIRGEGLVGVTRGFMYAGAPRVVASLWKVDDEATAALMRRFYQGMLKDGLRPAAALRAAQLALRQTRRWRSPAYWAGFILQGEWH